MALLHAAQAAEIGVPPQTIVNLYGQIGLLDMPSARFAPDGELSFSVSSMNVQDRYAISFQALPWLETTFRYSRVDRWSTGGDDYDRSLGIKVRLVEESNYWPTVAIGAQDLLGTGVYGAEYLVASKRFGDFDFTGGIGWRRFGDNATFTNPFTLIFKSFKDIPPPAVTVGTPLIGQFFHGPHAGLFGGATWNTPVDGLTLILEASGDRYVQQQATGAIHIKTPLNIGFAYQPSDNFQIGGGYMYGAEFAVQGTFRLNALHEPAMTRLGPPPPDPVIRSQDVQQDAVMSLLQDSTHYYSNWPASAAKPAAHTQAASLRTAHHLADTLFTASAYRQIKIESVGSFGDSLLIDVAGRTNRLDCAEFVGLSQTARDNGFREIVFSSKKNPDVTFCDTSPVTARDGDALPQYASNAPIEEAVDVPSAAAAPQPGPTDAGSPALPIDVKGTEDKIVDGANRQDIGIYSLSISDHRIDVAFFNSHYRTDSEAIGRLLRVLMQAAPPSVEIFRLVIVASDIPITELTINRSDVERVLNNYGSAQELLPLSGLEPAPYDDPLVANPTRQDFPYFGYSIFPGYRQSLFDPNQPYRYEIYAGLGGFAKFNRNFSIEGGAEVNIVNTVQDITRVSNSVLPHVRSDFAEYYKNGINGIAYLQASYTTKLSDDVYAYGRAGILEDMFAGAGGEIYWQPAHKRWSIGADLYAVQQRGFDRLFDLRPYRTVVGHVSLYYDSPYYDLDFAIHAGRFLAGDYGATFEITRRFASGVEVGAFATLTNVPFAEFGEGSFDKGVILRIPLDNLFPVNTQDVADMDFKPLTRDGGAPLDGEYMLHDMVQTHSEADLLQNWGEVLYP